MATILDRHRGMDESRTGRRHRVSQGEESPTSGIARRQITQAERRPAEASGRQGQDAGPEAPGNLLLHRDARHDSALAPKAHSQEIRWECTRAVIPRAVILCQIGDAPCQNARRAPPARPKSAESRFHYSSGHRPLFFRAPSRELREGLMNWERHRKEGPENLRSST